MSKFKTNNSLYEPLENTNWGFNTYSEKINGRAAMIGFVLLFLYEIINKQKILSFII